MQRQQWPLFTNMVSESESEFFRLTLILAWISNYIHYKAWDQITHCCLGDVPTMLNAIFDILLNIVMGISGKIALCKLVQTCTDD